MVSIVPCTYISICVLKETVGLFKIVVFDCEIRTLRVAVYSVFIMQSFLRSALQEIFSQSALYAFPKSGISALFGNIYD